MSDEPDLVSTRGSAFDYTDILEGDPALQARLARSGSGGLYQHMFLEDMSQMLPWGRGLDDGFTATVTADDHDRAATLIREALPSRYGPARTLEEGVRGLTEEASQSPTTWPDYLRDRLPPPTCRPRQGPGCVPVGTDQPEDSGRTGRPANPIRPNAAGSTDRT